jgi:DNA-binding transcriptional ArsR family regulator
VAAKRRSRGKQGKTRVPKEHMPRPKIKKRSSLEPVDQRLMKALSHPLRVQILTLINERPWCPADAAKELDEGLSQASYHFKVLKDLGCIELVGTEPRRGAVAHFYKPVARIIVPEGMAADLPKSARLELLGKVIHDSEKDIHEALKAGTFYERDDLHASWTPMDLDDQGCKDLHARFDELLQDALEIAGDSANRIAEGAESIPVSAVLFGFVSARETGSRTLAHRKRG